MYVHLFLKKIEGKGNEISVAAFMGIIFVLKAGVNCIKNRIGKLPALPRAQQ
jgi:hypothetical protein